MKRLIVLALAALLLAGPALGADKVEVSGDSFVVDEAKSQSVFSGNVVVSHPSVKVWASQVEVQYGAGGPSDIKSFVARGAVKLETREQTATGDLAVFDPRTQILTLSGNVKVTNATGTVDAPQLTVDIKNNTSTFTGSKSGGRVTGVFTAP